MTCLDGAIAGLVGAATIAIWFLLLVLLEQRLLPFGFSSWMRSPACLSTHLQYWEKDSFYENQVSF
jgi:hypothetical protein